MTTGTTCRKSRKSCSAPTEAVDPQIGADVYEQLRFDLCPECRKKFLKNPLGANYSKQFDFSKN